MRIYSKPALAGLVAAAVFSVAVSAASARSFRVSEQNFEDIYPSLEVLAAGNVVRCPITFLGHYEEGTYAKELLGNIAKLRHVIAGSCTGGTATALAETLPWDVFYESFEGRLPDITGEISLIIRMQFRVKPTGSQECLAGTTIEHPADYRLAMSNGTVTGLRLDETRRIPIGGGFLCSLAGEASIAGSAAVRNLPDLGALTVTLI